MDILEEDYEAERMVAVRPYYPFGSGAMFLHPLRQLDEF
jgi:hypothetical protein